VTSVCRPAPSVAVGRIAFNRDTWLADLMGEDLDEVLRCGLAAGVQGAAGHGVAVVLKSI
jgi:hypothetical protein